MLITRFPNLQQEDLFCLRALAQLTHVCILHLPIMMVLGSHPLKRPLYFVPIIFKSPLPFVLVMESQQEDLLCPRAFGAFGHKRPLSALQAGQKCALLIFSCLLKYVLI